MSLPDLTEVRKEYTANGNLFRVSCDYLTSPEVSAYNDFRNVIVPSYFDLVYDCYDEPLNIADRLSERLLLQAAEHWKIMPNGEPCDGVPVQVDDNALVSVSTEPGNKLVATLSCQTLVPGEGECCTVIQNEMTFMPYPEYSEIDLWAFVKKQFDEETLIEKGEKIRAAFIGSVIEIAPADGTDVGGSTTEVAGINRGVDTSNDSNALSAVGGVIIGALVAAVLGVGFLLVRRRRGRRARRNLSDDASDFYPQVAVLSDAEVGQGENYEVVTDDLYGAAAMAKHDKRRKTHSPTSDVANNSSSADYEYDSSNISTPGNSSYAWDLSTSFQREVMSTYGQASPSAAQQPKGPHQQQYGPTTIEVVPPYPLDETTESEADSWAQTEGTIGSIEEDLEAITAEI